VSIESLVSEFGTTLYLYRPTVTRSSDGRMLRTFALSSTLTGFVQPNGQSEDTRNGRQNSRTGCTVYFSGSQDIRIEDELSSTSSGAGDRWRVTGAWNPGEVNRLGGSHRLNMTVVDAVEVAPQVSP